MTLTGEEFLQRLRAISERVVTGQGDAVAAAVAVIADSVAADGVVHAFGSGHSEALAMEVAGRAGGLVPTNRLALRDVVLLGGEPPAVLSDTTAKLERDPDVGGRVLALHDIRSQDCFVLASSSGVNGSVVGMALAVKEHGHPLIAVTSREHTARVSPKHPSGQKLVDVADVVLDNGAPYGDAVLELPGPGGGAVGAVSSITAATLAQLVTVGVVAELLARGVDPPVYLSANIPGGDAHNAALEARYAGRIRRLA